MEVVKGNWMAKVFGVDGEFNHAHTLKGATPEEIKEFAKGIRAKGRCCKFVKAKGDVKIFTRKRKGAAE